MSWGADTLKGHRLISTLPCLLLVGCGPLWNALNRSGLESDVRDILNRAAVGPQQLDCRMVGTTRDAPCSLRMTPSEAASVIRTLELERIDSASDGPTPLARVVAHADPSCLAKTSTAAAVFAIAGRTDSLRLPSGSAFDYLLLTINASTGQTCLQVSYAYG